MLALGAVLLDGRPQEPARRLKGKGPVDEADEPRVFFATLHGLFYARKGHHIIFLGKTHETQAYVQVGPGVLALVLSWAPCNVRPSVTADAR